MTLTRRAEGRAAALALLGASTMLVACAGGGAPSPARERGPAAVRSTAAASEPAPRPWFTEVAAQAGLDFVHRSGDDGHFRFPEISVGGGAFVDFDGDGWLDVYLVQAGSLDPAAPGPRPGNRLYRNRGDGTFEDVTERAGVGDTGYGSGCAVGDVDGDGDPDLYVTNVGPDVLYRNEGDGTFTDVTAAAGLGSKAWGTSAAFFDFDDDGDRDLYVAQYVAWTPESDKACYRGAGVRDYCGPNAYAAPVRDVLYRNEGDGTFTDVSEAMGLGEARGNGLGVVCADFDGDGWVDVYVANDGMPNQMWMNREGRRFEDRAMAFGTSVNEDGAPEAGMGVVAFDLEGDGDLEILLTHLANETNTCYVDGGAAYDDRTARLGLALPSLPNTGFGVGVFDFDQDGWQDVFVANGRVTLPPVVPETGDPFEELDQLLAGRPDGTFAVVSPAGGTDPPLRRTSRAAAFGDYDGDGDVDVLVVERDARVSLLRNEVARPGAWLSAEVLDARGRHALGAMVGVRSASRWQWRLVGRAFSYQASNDVRVHFGLGDAEADELVVRWLDGTVESFGAQARGRVVALRRGAGEVVADTGDARATSP